MTVMITIRRRLALASAVFVSVFVSLFVSMITAPQAQAAPSCKTAAGLLGGVAGGIYSLSDPGMNPPVPAMPGRGAPALFDGRNPNLPGNGIYARHGYAGLSWSTYDTGCFGPAGDPSASTDTYLGNMALGTAVTLVGAIDGVHNFAGSSGVGRILDPVTAKLSQGVSSALFRPWVGFSLLVLGLGVIVAARKGTIPQAASTVAWALIVMTVAAGVLSYPTLASTTARGLINSTVGTVNQTMMGESPTDRNPGGERANLIVGSVLYPQWLRGELGASSGPTVDKYGRRLFDDQALSWADARHPTKQAVSTRQSDFKKAAAGVQSDDPAAYRNLTGQAGGRLGAGLVALFGVIMVGLFPLVADLLVLAALVIISLLCVLFPALAVIGLHPRMAGVVKGALNMGGAALINSVMFSVGAAVALRVAGLVLTTTIIPQWAALIICGVVCAVLWMMLKPFRRLTAMVGGNYNPAASIGETMGGARRLAGRVASTVVGSRYGARYGARGGVREGIRESQETEPESDPEPEPTPETYSRPTPTSPPRVRRPALSTTAPGGRPGPGAAPGPTPEPPESDGRPEWADPDGRVISVDQDPDGVTQWRVWNPATKRVEVIRREYP